MRRRICTALPVCTLALLGVLAACRTGGKLREIRSGRLQAELSTARDRQVTSPPRRGNDPDSLLLTRQDTTLVVEDLEGNRVILMKAAVDSSGELMASDVLDAAVVTARFKNVAERGGKVDIRFTIRVPEGMRDSRWQLRFTPEMYILGDSLDLEPVLITGSAYRKRQLRGYEQYERFLARIISDTTRLIDLAQLEVFVRRNLPDVYRFKTDSSFVSDETFASYYGVTEQEALQHYTKAFLIRRNARLSSRREKMYRRYVKVPIEAGGIRLDTVIRAPDGSFSYEYVETVHTRPGLRKVEISLGGGIYEEDRRLASLERGEPLTFYISSLSTLTEDRERYLTRVIERKVTANTACYIAFQSGKADIQPSLGGNAGEIGRIRENLRALLLNREFDLDSILVTATCSPEGSWGFNQRLSLRRSESVAAYFDRYLDSLRQAERSFHIDLTGEAELAADEAPDIRFLSRSEPENWELLERLVRADSLLSPRQKADYLALAAEPDPDRREHRLRDRDYYRHLRDDLYPRLRIVRFDFHLHRKGMVRDTVHTTVPDTVYRSGLQALRDRDYARAVSILSPYRDYNTAVAYCAAGMGASAMDVLRHLPDDDKTYYLKAILYSREGDEKHAVECYLRACSLNPSYVSRGNLDPEIATLIAKYSLNQEPDEY